MLENETCYKTGRFSTSDFTIYVPSYCFIISHITRKILSAYLCIAITYLDEKFLRYSKSSSLFLDFKSCSGPFDRTKLRRACDEPIKRNYPVAAASPARPPSASRSALRPTIGPNVKNQPKIKLKTRQIEGFLQRFDKL